MTTNHTTDPRMAELLRDVEAECQDLERLVAPLDEEQWRRPTPAEGWTIAHQLAHLAWTEEALTMALLRPHQFLQFRLTLPSDAVDRAAEDGASRGGPACLSRWRTSWHTALEALTDADPKERVQWFGPSMSARTAATARVMEVWSHGQDIADALGVARPPTPRLRHIAHLGVVARDHAFSVNGLPPPDAPFRVELTGPDGELWTWGPPQAEQSVHGPAHDFALLCTQRRHVDDVDLHAQGEQARTWLSIAQAFAGPPGSGRPPRATEDGG